MIDKRDINTLRTPEDLERKYDLKSIFSLKENYELQKNGLNKVENELTNFANATTKNLEELQNQVDGNITTWFFKGVPTTENSPANEWIEEKEKIKRNVCYAQIIMRKMVHIYRKAPKLLTKSKNMVCF